MNVNRDDQDLLTIYHTHCILISSTSSEDGMDETLIPVDYQKAGHIVDDEVHDVLVRGLPAGVRLTGIMDCCHSESILDLPYVYTVNGDLQIMETSKNEGIVTLVSAGTRFLLDGNKKRAVSSITQVSKCLLSRMVSSLYNY